MRAGQLDRRITIERATTVKGFGEDIETWATHLDNWPARVQEKSGREALTAGGLSAEVDTVFTIRWDDDVLETDRVVYDGRRYNIKFIREIGRRRGREILAQFVEAAP